MIRMKITDANTNNYRYEVPVPITWRATTSQSQQQNLRFELTETQYNQTGLRVRRQMGTTIGDNDPILFDTTYFAEGFICDNQFLQIITTLPSKNVYGFGENTHPSFRHNLTDGIRYGIFARDQPPQGQNENLYGTHPFYMCIEDDGKVVFPDFLYPPTKSWWLNQIVTWHNTRNFDALWIDMNEPANFDTNMLQPWNWPYSTPWNLHRPTDEQWDAPSYHPAIWSSVMSDKTICMLALQTNGNMTYRHYDVHNLFGWSETIATLPAVRASVPGRRSFVISRSTFPSSGVYAGHWTGDNSALWPFVKYNIIGLLEFNLFGIPYIGADICGFNLNTTEELCQRWMQLGAFKPFFRNHNAINLTDQDPGVFSPPVVASNRKAVILRYTLIPYLYTLFYNVHVDGGTVVRSMAHEYPQDSNCWDLDEQFLWGSSLLIAPVIYKNQITKNSYLPPSPVRWYDYYTGQEQTKLENVTVDAPLDYIPLFIKGGSILPTQQYALNTNLSRQNLMSLIIALDQNQTARGSLFWDDGDSVDTYENKITIYLNSIIRVTIQLQSHQQPTIIQHHWY
ncbi:unnamed protein product [Rotaria sordida]|uniref:alpha-glucosidase n=1 Tax=Rotaria sordida TaxID=392033 RepID=A0A814LDD4_9BILA|nr:unnamed protein product [Rotaria sordida]